MRRDRRERSGRADCELDNHGAEEDGDVPYQSACRLSQPNRQLPAWGGPACRRAGLGKAEPGADAGPASPQAPPSS